MAEQKKSNRNYSPDNEDYVSVSDIEYGVVINTTSVPHFFAFLIIFSKVTVNPLFIILLLKVAYLYMVIITYFWIKVNIKKLTAKKAV